MIQEPDYRYELTEVRKQLAKILQQVDDLLERTPIHQINYPHGPMTKAEMVQLFHTTSRTFSNWLKPYQSELEKMGVTKKQKKLPEKAVRFLCEKFTI